ncbi:hypothetical protein bpr_II212 (plasmid) [Butyrivibrio proteoclasticus B316]|uniref:Uncharacterized protein n=1 Tax=Butyrivibrio proteoclasticus (strain ATCC 51982 / DSM 14932 / B316) TaxID=515622 RepID=E0S418_BUTPB|nr:hypothetical protein [Butyrivibrio proteoclasticus]ADL36150.1 hypothetical protein bpr_II212 [Butyrivibrio proteoclasticus B316]
MDSLPSFNQFKLIFPAYTEAFKINAKSALEILFVPTNTIKKVATGGYRTYATEPNDIIVVPQDNTLFRQPNYRPITNLSRKQKFN